MEPPVISAGKFKGQLVILIIIFPYINGKSIAAQIMEGFAGDLLLSGSSLPADIPAVYKLFLDLGQIFFLFCNV